MACPGDLTSERSRFPHVLEAVNNLRAHSLGFHLEPVGWERVIPSFGRPQDLINRELEAAHLAVVMFWNRIGSPAAEKGDRTGTIEEFELASRRHEEYGTPLVWVYFKKPTVEPDSQLQAVLAFRKKLEEGRQLFFREYGSLDEWEQMFREHLVAYLDGLRRSDLDHNFRYAMPEHSVLRGRFLGNGMYRYGTAMRFDVDLDGDGNDEAVTFRFVQNWFLISVFRHGTGFEFSVPFDDPDWTVKVAEVAIKDVNNDGLPDVLVALWDGVITLKLFVFGLNGDGRLSREITRDTFTLLHQVEGQRIAYLHEGGTIILPYGSQGLFTEVKWVGDHFENYDKA